MNFLACRSRVLVKMMCLMQANRRVAFDRAWHINWDLGRTTQGRKLEIGEAKAITNMAFCSKMG